jgi:hypothetical protein
MLGKKYKIACISEAREPVALRKTAVLGMEKTERGVLYITDTLSRLSNMPNLEGMSFLLVMDPHSAGLPERFASADAACIRTRGGAGGDIQTGKVLEDAADALLALQEWNARLLEACLWTKNPLAKFIHEAAGFLNFPIILYNHNLISIAHSAAYFSKADVQWISARNLPVWIDNGGGAKTDAPKKLENINGAYIFPELPCSQRQLLYYTPPSGKLTAILAVNIGQRHPARGLLDLVGHIAHLLEKIIRRDPREYGKKDDDGAIFHEAVKSVLFQPNQNPGREAASAIRTRGWRFEDAYQVICVHFPDEEDFERNAAFYCKQIESYYLYICALLKKPYLLLAVNRSAEAKGSGNGGFDGYLRRFVHNTNRAAGVSHSSAGLLSLHDQYIEAGYALRSGENSNPSQKIHKFSEYVIEYIMEHAAGELSSRELIHEALFILKEHDDREKTEYVKTLNLILASKFNMTTAAKKLFIHRVTIFRRFEKIQELTQVDFEDPREILHLVLSLWLYEKQLSNA